MRFGWRDTIRYFGRSTMSNALPRWYPFIWLPVMLSPVTFLVFLWGLGRGALRRSLAPQSFLLPTRARRDVRRSICHCVAGWRFMRRCSGWG